MSKPQYNIHMHDASAEFTDCWATAGNHLLDQVERGQLNIYRTDLIPPIREHHVFRLGNQLITVFIEDLDNQLITPSSLEGVIGGSISMNATPCIMEMQRDMAGRWQVVNPRWGLIHAETRKEVFPPDLVTDEKIEMSDWELKDFAIQSVTTQLRENGGQVASHCSDPGINPSIWYVDENNVFSYAIVEVVRCPNLEAPIPYNLKDIVDSVRHESEHGYFYSVSVSNSQELFAPDDGEPMKLWRGDGYLVNASEPIHVSSLLQKY